VQKDGGTDPGPSARFNCIAVFSETVHEVWGGSLIRAIQAEIHFEILIPDGSRAKGDLIFADDTRGAADMTRYLVSLGHTHIWFVGNTRLPWFARCFAATAG
jgi:hypothetical protein